MNQHQKPTEPAEGDGGSRRTQLLSRSRDVTGGVGGFIFIGGFPPSIADRLKTRDADEREEPVDAERVTPL
jgi:hypothetical protein